MLKTINKKLNGRHGKPVTLDITCIPDGKPKPGIIFLHGFKGFKDWGHWSVIAAAFALKGYVFLKFNFAFNGTTPEHPLDFADLEAFGNNNYSKELDDTDVVLDWLFNDFRKQMPGEVDFDKISIIGHSRGGPLAIVKTHEDPRLKAAVTWASVHSLAYAWQIPGFIDNWKEKEVYHVLNGRTGQQMPLYYQLFEDYERHNERFNLEVLLRHFKKPLLILHGTDDPGVSYSAAEELHNWYPQSEMVLIDGADHVFGGRHPFTQKNLPEHSSKLIEHTCRFLENHFK